MSLEERRSQRGMAATMRDGTFAKAHVIRLPPSEGCNRTLCNRIFHLYEALAFEGFDRVDEPHQQVPEG